MLIRMEEQDLHCPQDSLLQGTGVIDLGRESQGNMWLHNLYDLPMIKLLQEGGLL